MSYSSWLLRLRDEAVAAITQRSEPRHRTQSGTIVDYAAGDNGQVISWTIQPEDADGDVPLIVPPRGMAGEGVGATVLLEGIGGATGTLWDIKRVTKPGVGTTGTFPGVPLATPVIDSIHTSIEILRPGAIIVFAYLTIYLIASHWRHGQMVGYEAEVRNTAGQKVAQGSVQPFGIVWGRLDDELGSGVTTPFDLEAGIGYPNQFGASWGIIGIEEDELVLYRTYKADTREFGNTTRGYDGTSDETHPAESFVRLRGLGLATSGTMQPNENYEGRVRAVAADGRESNWTDWFPFTTEYDTTAPSWSGAVGLTVLSIREGFALNWNPADTDADDLAYYEVRASSDGSSGWVTQRAGNGTGWVWQAKAGSRLYYQVRAVDTSENASSWSGSVRVGMDIADEIVADNLLDNGDFPTDVSIWSTSGTGSAILNHDPTRGFKGDGCAQFELTRTGLGADFAIYQTAGSLTPGDVVRGYAYVQRAANFDETFDEMWLELRSGLAVSSSPRAELSSLEVVDSPYWTKLEAEIVVPAGASSVTAYVFAEYSGTPAEVTFVWADDVQLYKVGNKVEDDSRLDGIEGDIGDLEDAVDDLQTDLSAVESEIVAARAGKSDLDARFDQIESSVTALARFYMRYSTNAGQNLTSGTNVVVDYEDLSFESVDYVATGASWKFQPTVAGVYRITASLQMASNNWTAGDLIQIGVFKNASATAFSRVYLPTMTATIPQITITELVSFNGSSDYIDIRGGGIWAGGGNRALSTDNRMNYVLIDRI